MSKYNANEKVKIGDIFVNSWGYDQTNIDYYQVIRKTAKMVVLLPIKSRIEEDSFMQGRSYPLKDNFVQNTEQIKKTPYEYKGDTCVSGDVWVSFEYGSGKLFTGEYARCSWYA